jgi:cytochrome c heme-lyase
MMNEATWLKILEWEDLVTTTKPVATPKLLRFCGRPSELSPKARMKYWFFGHPLPFDCHNLLFDVAVRITVNSIQVFIYLFRL